MSLGALVLLVGVVTSVGGRSDGGFIVLQHLRFAPGYLALGGALVSVGLALRRLTIIRVVVSTAIVAVGGLGLAALGALSLIAGSDPGEVHHRSAAPHRPYAVHVIEGYDAVDPIVTVWVEQRRGPVSRAWRVGCTGDDTVTVRWASSDQIRISGADGASVIRVDPHTGRPVGDRPDVLHDCDL